MNAQNVARPCDGLPLVARTTFALNGPDGILHERVPHCADTPLVCQCHYDVTGVAWYHIGALPRAVADVLCEAAREKGVVVKQGRLPHPFLADERYPIFVTDPALTQKTVFEYVWPALQKV